MTRWLTKQQQTRDYACFPASGANPPASGSGVLCVAAGDQEPAAPNQFRVR